MRIIPGLAKPRITNKLRGALGEIYYKVYCEQSGWAYTSLEDIYNSMNSKWIFTFKQGFHRIQVSIPKEIHSEINMLVKPTNNSVSSPSFVYDFLACRVGRSKKYEGIQSSDFFTWVESKTGNAKFSSSQVNAMSKIKLPLAIFHTDDVLEKPESIEMKFDIKKGKKWLDDLVLVDNEIYEFAESVNLPKQKL